MLQTLQHFISNPKEEILLFDESQHPLFLTYALPLLASGYSVGPITLDIIKSLSLEVKRTDLEGVFTCSHPVAQPSILCFSSGTKKHQKGIIRTYQSWQHSFSIIAKEITDFPSTRAIVLGSLPYSLSLFGAMESVQRGKRPLLFPTQNLRFYTTLDPKENYILWATPSHCSFFIHALANEQIKPIETVKYVFVGGAHFSNQLRSQLQQVFPKAHIYSFYGASETSFIALKSPDDASESVGVLCQGVTLSIRDRSNQQLPSDSPGTLWVKSNQVFDSYLHKGQKINQLEGFISINDTGFLDNQNRLFFSGRTARKVSISGHIIDLDALEKWYKRELQKEDIVLFVKPNETKENTLILCAQYPIAENQWQRLKKKALRELGTQGVAKKWVHCPEWPLLKNGKVDMQKLKSFL